MSTRFDPTPEPADRSDEAPVEPVTATGRVSAHRPSVLHLVIGLIFLGVAALWALSASGAVGSDDTWLLPGLLVVAGATGLVAALAGSRRHDDT